MSNHQHIIDDAKAQLEKLGDELNELDQKMKAAGNKVEAWSTKQMHQMRADWHECHAYVERLSAQSETSFEQAKSETERHWKALEAAVKTYREQIQNHAA
ncbi:MAG: hypothetical protein ACR2OV_03080 [Hyphomicrobiaceae bacterium]